jgi:hypothetical protein
MCRCECLGVLLWIKSPQLTNDVDLIYTRIGGRVNVDDLATLEPFITMTDVQVNHFYWWTTCLRFCSYIS